MKSELEQRLPIQSLRKARSDGHARRRPRPCGLTIHSAIGCPNKCLYCYIQDMGFDFIEARPYGLTGEELAYALILNPYFVPGIWGTFLAFGSIADPFNKNVIEKTLEYFNAIEKLGNPCQFSTKAYIRPETIKRLSSIRLPINPLITIVTIKRANKLEPNAPTVESRLKTIKNLKSAGFKPMLFLRPIIPGVNDDEFDEIFKEAKRAGAVGAVIGGFRVTKRIIERLQRAGFDIKQIIKRKPKKAVLSEEQIPIKISDLKRKAIHQAKRRGLIAFASACCANAYNAGVPCPNLCWLKGQCTNCPNKCADKVPSISESEVADLIKMLTKRKIEDASVEDSKVTVKIGFKMSRREMETIKYVIQLFTRRRVLMR